MSAAFYHALLDEDIWVDLPKGEEDEHGVVWQSKNALFRTRRAALLFQEYVVQAMVKIGWRWLFLHGDDFIASGETQWHWSNSLC